MQMFIWWSRHVNTEIMDRYGSKKRDCCNSHVRRSFAVEMAKYSTMMLLKSFSYLKDTSGKNVNRRTGYLVKNHLISC